MDRNEKEKEDIVKSLLPLALVLGGLISAAIALILVLLYLTHCVNLERSYVGNRSRRSTRSRMTRKSRFNPMNMFSSASSQLMPSRIASQSTAASRIPSAPEYARSEYQGHRSCERLKKVEWLMAQRESSFGNSLKVWLDEPFLTYHLIVIATGVVLGVVIGCLYVCLINVTRDQQRPTHDSRNRPYLRRFTSLFTGSRVTASKSRYSQMQGNSAYSQMNAYSQMPGSTLHTQGNSKLYSEGPARYK